jgi:hypothetical protein
MVTRSDRTSTAATHDTTTPVILPTAAYSLDQARRLLGLKKNCLPREARLGRLRVSKRAGRYFVLGEWLLEWISTGELARPARKSDEIG